MKAEGPLAPIHDYFDKNGDYRAYLSTWFSIEIYTWVTLTLPIQGWQYGPNAQVFLQIHLNLDGKPGQKYSLNVEIHLSTSVSMDISTKRTSEVRKF